MQLLKEICCILFAVLMVFSLMQNIFDVNVYAEETENKILGKLYSFDKKSEYDISKTDKYIFTDKAETYGVFSIKGDICETNKYNGVSAFIVKNGRPLFTYKYDDTLLNEESSERKLCSDSNNIIDDKKLEDDIRYGAIIIETSKNRESWIKKYEKTNVFEEIPVSEESFHSASDIEIANGCFYKVTVAYETKIKSQNSESHFWDRDGFEVSKNAEVYEFYLSGEETLQQPDSKLRTRLGKKIRTEEFDGYYGDAGELKDNDPHFGWDLGYFFVAGHSADKTDTDNPVFLKKEGDKLILWFHLDQNINALNDNPDLTISYDKDGSDRYFEVGPLDMQRGTLIVRYTDHENITHEPQVYTNFLEANASVGADTKISLFEEGDYEVALDYEITSDKIVDKIGHYRIAFKFSVRNSNAMIFLFDKENGNELNNGAVTKNGFRLDLAKSRYLDVYVKKEVLTETEDGLTEDVRFNHAACDGQEYLDEGIYTVTVKNKYTDQQTEKRIYIGDNKIIKAHMHTGKTIPEINDLVESGVKIDKAGRLSTEEDYGKTDIKEIMTAESNPYKTILFIAVPVIMVLVIIIAVKVKKRGERR